MSQAEEQIVMQDGAYGTVEVPAAPKKKSIKRLVVASVRRLSGNQNFTARSCCIVASSSTPSTRRLLDGVVLLVPHGEMH